MARDPEGKLRDGIFFCTDLVATPMRACLCGARRQVLKWVVMRWSVEVTFEEAQKHLGMETRRQWSDKAIERQRQ